MQIKLPSYYTSVLPTHTPFNFAKCGLKKKKKKSNFGCAPFPGNAYRNCLHRKHLQRQDGGRRRSPTDLDSSRPCAASSSPVPRGCLLSLHFASQAPHITNVFHEGLSASHHARVPSSLFSSEEETCKGSVAMTEARFSNLWAFLKVGSEESLFWGFFPYTLELN